MYEELFTTLFKCVFLLCNGWFLHKHCPEVKYSVEGETRV